MVLISTYAVFLCEFCGKAVNMFDLSCIYGSRGAAKNRKTNSDEKYVFKRNF